MAAAEVAPSPAAERAELRRLRERVKVLQAQLVKMLQAQLDELGGAPASTVQTQGSALDTQPDLFPQVNEPGPGIYRCVYSPRVAIRAAPSLTAQIIGALPKGGLVRVSEVISGAWARVDKDEVWARFTNAFPRRANSKLSGPVHEDELAGPAPREHAFILINGQGTKIQGPLLSRLPQDEAAQACWEFGAAPEVRREEEEAVAIRCLPNTMEATRHKFVQEALRYVGTPCRREYHDPRSIHYMPGSTHQNAGFFVDDVGLVRLVVDGLKADFGFVLDPACNLEHLFYALPTRVTSKDLRPGDLVFYESFIPAQGGLLCPSGDVHQRKVNLLLHVEIFIRKKESVGSVPWFAHPRTGGIDGVQRFENFAINQYQEQDVQVMHFCSLETWLEAQEATFAHGVLMRQKRNIK